MYSKLTEIISQQSLLTTEQVDEISAYANARDLDFLSAAFEMSLLTEGLCLELAHAATGLSVVSLEHWNVNDEAALRVPETVVRDCNILPLHIFRTTLVVAIGHDDADSIIDALRERTGLNVRVQFGLSTLIARNIEYVFPTAPARSVASMAHPLPLTVSGTSQILNHGGLTQAGLSGQSVIAVLESDATSLANYRAACESLPLRIEPFNEGSQLLRFAEGAQIDLVLLGTTQFGLNALEVCRILKSEAHTQTIPIFLLSRTIKEREWKLHPRAKLADEFFEKPFDGMHLVQKLRHYVEFTPEWIDVSINEDSMDSSITQSGASGSRFRKPAGDFLPSEPLACLAFSETLETQGATYQALEWLEKAVKLDESSFKLRSALAQFYERHGYTTLALDAW
jgi:DNA-binding response OmpR family regulator